MRVLTKTKKLLEICRATVTALSSGGIARSDQQEELAAAITV